MAYNQYKKENQPSLHKLNLSNKDKEAHIGLLKHLKTGGQNAVNPW